MFPTALLNNALASIQQNGRHQRSHTFPQNFGSPRLHSLPFMNNNSRRDSMSDMPPPRHLMNNPTQDFTLDIVDLTADDTGGGSTNNDRKRKHADGDQNTGAPRPKQKRRTRDADGFTQLSEQIDEYTQEHSQSDDMLQRKQNLRSALQNAIWRRYPHATVHLVGSTWNGFASGSSDVDLCVVVEKGKEVNRMECLKYLRAIEKLVQPINALQKIELIRARVPILTFDDSVSGCECDMNINNETGIRNTHLLRTYAKMDDRVCPLVLAVKRWAKARKIADAKVGMLSSYSLVLMVLHYLQVGCWPPVLKSLRKHYPEHFKEDSDVDQLPMSNPAEFIPCNDSTNNASLGKLFAGFVHYYDTYHWDTHAISVRAAASLERSSSPHFKDKWICIEEPFELYNTARSVYDFGNFNTIKREFKMTNMRLKQKENPCFEYILNAHVSKEGQSNEA